jgi:hypothetical protein
MSAPSTRPGYLREALRAGQQMRTLAHGNLGPGERAASEAWLRAMGWEPCAGCGPAYEVAPRKEGRTARRACYVTGWHFTGGKGTEA